MYSNPDFETSFNRKPKASQLEQTINIVMLGEILLNARDNWLILVLPDGKLYLQEVEGDFWEA